MTSKLHDYFDALLKYFNESPIQALALAAALIAIATTPIAFAILGRLDWFQARRGRVMMKPSFASIVVGMLLVMGIPAIFAALVVKSDSFDKNRYEFDPNKNWSVLEQGARYKTVAEANAAVEKKEEELNEVRKNLVENVKKLDEAMLAMRAASSQSPATAQAIPAVLERLAGVRRSVGVDAPQQLMDFTAPPAALPPPVLPPAVVYVSAGSAAPSMPATPAAPSATPTGSLTKADADAELATVAEPQRALTAMLPLTDVPAGWTVSKYGSKHFESFDDKNMFEKIDGRAESFTQNNVTGMAYSSYHPIGDDSNEIQVYIFEFDHTKPFRAQSKYNSEKPEQSEPVKVGTEGYAAAGSLLFYADPYYTQIVSTKDDKQFAAISLELAKKIAAKQVPEHTEGESPMPNKATALQDAIYALFPKGGGPPNYAAQDVFGYSFLSDVFMADYKADTVTWQGFLRPYATEDEAKAIFEKYVDSARKNGGDPKLIESPGADQMFLSASIGLVDVIFRKGNVIGGANGAADSTNNEAKARETAENFARNFVKALPSDLPKGAPAENKPEKPAEGDQD